MLYLDLISNKLKTVIQCMCHVFSAFHLFLQTNSIESHIDVKSVTLRNELKYYRSYAIRAGCLDPLYIPNINPQSAETRSYKP